MSNHNPHKNLDAAIAQRLGTRADAATWPLVGAGTTDEPKNYIEVYYPDIGSPSGKSAQSYEFTVHFDAWGWNCFSTEISDALINVHECITTPITQTSYSPLSIANYGLSKQWFDKMNVDIPTGNDEQKHGQLRMIFRIMEDHI
jgi:hypothetical protein